MTEETADLEMDAGGSRAATLVDIHVGQRIKAARLIVGLSQMELGARIGLTFQQVQKYEKGVNRVGAGRLLHLSKVLSRPIQYFFDDLPPDAIAGEQEQRDNQVIDAAWNDFGRQEIEVAKAFGRISDSAIRRTLLAHIRAVADNAND